MPRRLPTVVLVGRPNVGKSTLFNRMTGSRRAIVNAMAGTTRDSLNRPVEWRGVSFQLSDTGGLYGASLDPLHELVVKQGQKAIVGADLVVFVCDAREGLVSGDQTIAQELRASGKPMILAINKTDDNRARNSAADFYSLGLEPIFEISAEHGTGVAELLDAITEKLPGKGRRQKAQGTEDEANEEDAEESPVSSAEPQETTVAIVGRPNVGKSSLVNRLLREE